jgi:ABC-type glycerol-3-phosphate transport system substrate-binding protein
MITQNGGTLMKRGLFLILTGLVALAFTAAPVAAQAKVKLTVWGRDLTDTDPAHLYISALVKNFQAKNPDIQLDYVALGDPGLADKTKIAMANNTAPDIVQSWGGSVMGGYADAGRLLDLTADLKSVPGSAAASQAMSWKGKTYGVAPFFAIAGLYYNAGIFKSLGIKVPTTVEEFEKAADTLKAGGIQPFANGAKDKWPPLATYMYLVNRYGGDAFGKAQARKAPFNGDAFVKAALKYQDWVKKGYFGTKPLGEAYGDAQVLMETGKAGMMVSGSWLGGSFADPKTTDQSLAFAAFPVVTGGVGKVTDVMGMTDIGFIATKNGAAKKDAIVRFMKFAMGVETGAVEPGRISSVPGVKAPNPLTGQAAAVFAQAQSVQFWWDQDLPPTVTSPLNDTIQTFFLPDADVKANLTKFEALVTENVGPVKP